MYVDRHEKRGGALIGGGALNREFTVVASLPGLSKFLGMDLFEVEWTSPEEKRASPSLSFLHEF